MVNELARTLLQVDSVISNVKISRFSIDNFKNI